MVEEERQAAAALIAADPAFAALELSGAPIVAVRGKPARFVYKNAAALAAFDDSVDADSLLGRDGEASRLDILLQSARHSVAPRLERALIELRDGASFVTILCRQIEQSSDEPLFILAALGLRSAAAGGGSPQVAAEGGPRDAQTASVSKPLRDALIARCGQSAPRFLWKTDADGVFTEASPLLAEVAGADYAALCGRSAQEVARALEFGPAFAEALASRRSWSGVRVEWPIETPCCRAPTFLGGMPVFDKVRGFLGFEGFGVLRLDQAEACEPAPASAPEERGPALGNVVALRPPSAPGRDAGDRLTAAERDAFEEIGRALGEEAPPAPAQGSARELIDQVAKALEQARAPGAKEEGAPEQARLLDLLPFGVIVAREAEALYANRTLLDELGYADLPALAADGGLARIFTGRSPPHGLANGGVELRAQDGQPIDVEAHLQTIDWDGAPATLISLRRQSSRKATEDARLRAKDAEIAGLGVQLALLEASFEKSPAPTALLAKDGRIERTNSAFAKLLGKSPAEIGGQELATFLSVEERSRARARILGLAFGEAAEGGAPIDLVGLRDPAGACWRLTARPLELDAHPLRGDQRGGARDHGRGAGGARRSRTRERGENGLPRANLA